MTLDLILKALIERRPRPPLFPKQIWDDTFRTWIKESNTPALVQSLLHLGNDDLESCHRIAQEHENPSGNYLHAVMHRREGDLGNSAYWYARVGNHGVLRKMALRFPQWSPTAFIAQIQRNESGDEERLQEQQWVEWQLLSESLFTDI